MVETSATLTNPWMEETLGGNVIITGDDMTYTFPAGTKNFARLKVTGPLTPHLESCTSTTCNCCLHE